MTVENISWSISTKECCRPRRGVEPATSWSPVGRRIQLSHRGRREYGKHIYLDTPLWAYSSCRGTTDAILVVRQLHLKYLAVNKRLYMAFEDLEKVFDRVPRKVIWWALRKLGVEEWIVRLVQGMYANERSHVRVGEGYSEEFKVKVGVHQGSVLSPLLFIIILEAFTWVPLWGALGGPLCWWPCYHCWFCLCWGFTAQSTQWGHVERGQFTEPHIYWAGLVL